MCPDYGDFFIVLYVHNTVIVYCHSAFVNEWRFSKTCITAILDVIPVLFTGNREFWELIHCCVVTNMRYEVISSIELSYSVMP